MASVNLVVNSRLRFSSLLTIDGITFWDLWIPPSIPAQNDDIQYTVMSGDRIDLLAYKFYQDPVLWWVIATVNGLDLIPDNLVANSTIRIPSPRYVKNNLFQNVVQ